MGFEVGINEKLDFTLRCSETDDDVVIGYGS